MKTTEKNNKLIVEFMGLSYCEKHLFEGWYKNSEHNHRICSFEGLKYHNSWDWLMPVVIKIVSNEFRSECKSRGFDNWIETDLMDDILVNRFEFDKLYQAVIQFIEWYNEQKQ